MKTSAQTRDFLIHLIQSLEEANSHPILLRNYTAFPYEIGNDLDIFITRNSLSCSFTILTSTAALYGGRIAHLHRRGYFLAIWLTFSDACQPVHIDLYHGALTWHGLRFLDDNDLIESAQRVSKNVAFKIPSCAHESVVSCLASIMWGGFFKSRYQDHIQSLLADPINANKFSASLHQYFDDLGDILSADVLNGIASSRVDAHYARKLRMRLFAKSLQSQPINSFLSWLKHWLEEAACYFYRMPGLVVEYNDQQWSSTDLARFKELVGSYFGAVHEIKLKRFSPYRLIKCWRLRGKNHLVLLSGKNFSINGSLVQPSKESYHFNADQLSEVALSILIKRLNFQYNSL